MNVYFVKINGKIFGPFSSRKLQNMKNAGLIRENTPVSADRNTWKSAVDYPWLFVVSEAPPVDPDARDKMRTQPEFRSREDGVIRLTLGEKAERSPVPEPDGMEFWGRVISLIWNPACHVVAIRERFGGDGCLLASSAAFLFFVLSITFSLNFIPSLKELPLPLWKTIVLPPALVLFLTVYTTFVRLFFGSEEIRRMRASDFLTGTAALSCWGVLIPFMGVIRSFYWKTGGAELQISGYLVLFLFLFCCGAITSTLCFYESWTELGFVKKTAAVYLLPFAFFFAIFLVIIHF